MIGKSEANAKIESLLAEARLNYLRGHNIWDANSAVCLDMFVPRLRLGIITEELTEASTDTNPYRSRNTMQKRALLAKRAGIGLIQLTCDQVEGSPVYNRLVTAISAKRQSDAPVGARECHLVQLATSDARTFMSQWHSQGYAPSTKTTYALAHQGEILAAMSIGQPRFSKADIEILRYCAISLHPVSGGFDRLISAVKRNNPNQSIESYAALNPMFRAKTIYEHALFAQNGTTPPNYTWVSLRDGTRLSRYQCQKGKLVKKGYDPNLSETAIMRSLGYIRVFDAGSMRFQFEPDK